MKALQTAIEMPSQPARAKVGPVIHQEIVSLRKAGFRVFRAGSLHKVAGKLLTREQLLHMARQARLMGLMR